MKKILCTVMFFSFLANVSAQLKVNSAGQVGIGTASPQYKLDVTGSTRITGDTYTGDIYIGSDSNIIVTTNSAPVKFKVNGVLVGYTGSSVYTNVSFGYGALGANTTGSFNTANGIKALYSNTTGYKNTANGVNALSLNTTGSYNAANGNWSLGSNTTGNFNTAIGCFADVDTDNLSNTTAIGRGAYTTSSNQVRIGNSSVTDIGGYTAWSNISDKRTKKNIREDVPGFHLPQSIKTASLNIYNLQGKQLKQIAVTQRGEGFQLIAGSEFEPGIYLYALIADGREVDVKRMILTE